MSSPSRPRNRNDFHVAIICALPLEAEYVELVLDKCWGNEGQRYGKALADQNAYTTGTVGEHNVVLAHMPGMGSTDSAAVAVDLRSSFPAIKLALVVGICGAVPIHPKTREEVVLGDCILSTAVIQYDFGRRYPNGFVRKTGVEDSLGRARPEIRSLISKLTTSPARQRLEAGLGHHISILQNRVNKVKYPGVNQDWLYESTYIHGHKSQHDSCDKCHDDGTCAKDCRELGCDSSRLIRRERLEANKMINSNATPINLPRVHFGRFGSANTVMKSGQDRDHISNTDEIAALEMEGAGVWDVFPTIIIKAVCDYADSHKNKKWQDYAAAIAAACMKALLGQVAVMDLLASSISILSVTDDLQHAVKTMEPVWHVPFRRKIGFVGRTKELQRIMQDCSDPGGSRLTSIVGLGGIGKSGLALEAAYRVQLEQPECSILWFQATDESTFDKDLRDLGLKLNIPQVQDSNVDVKALVKAWLSDPKHGRWFLIVDNADDEGLWTKQPKQIKDSSLAQHLPDVLHGFVLVTTRSRRVASILSGKATIDLHLPDFDNAYSMFVNELKDTNVATNRSLALALLEKLGYLPLAIVQAASYLNMTQESISTYLDLLDQPEDEVIELLSENFGDSSRYPNAINPVALTWLVSFEQISLRNPLAAAYLSRMACLHDKNIPQSLLPKASSKLDAVNAIGTLTGYSLIRKQSGMAKVKDVGDVYDMHRLVHLATRNWLKMKATFEDHVKNSIIQLKELFPSEQYEYKDIWTVYMAHGERLCEENVTVSFPDRYKLQRFMGSCMLRDGRYSKAVEVFSEVVKRVESGLELGSKQAVIAYETLGEALSLNGDQATAEKYLLLAMRGYENEDIKENLDISFTQARLAGIYRSQGRWQEAESLQLEGLKTSQRVLGPDHSHTLTSLSNLALTYSHQGRLQEAEKLQLEVFKTRKRVLGVEHPDTLLSQSNLAVVYSRQGRWQEAEKLQSEVLSVSKCVSGSEHPNTLVIQNNLATTLWSQGKVQAAVELMSRCVQTLTRTLGPDHHYSKNSSKFLRDWQESIKNSVPNYWYIALYRYTYYLLYCLYRLIQYRRYT